LFRLNCIQLAAPILPNIQAWVNLLVNYKLKKLLLLKRKRSSRVHYRYSLRYFWAYNFLGTTYDVATELTKTFKRHREAPSAAVQEKVDALLAAQQAAAAAAAPPSLPGSESSGEDDE
jgi:hypothetical protein